MKRMAYVWLAGLLVVGMAALPSRAQSDSSLGDYARSVRKDKEDSKSPSSSKKYDNDNLPRNETLSVVGNATDEPADGAADKSAQKTDDKADAPKDDAQKAEDQKAADERKKKMDDEKEKIDLAARELDVLQREYRLRAAAFYADAGDRLRNSKDWDKQDAQYKQQIADKQKALDAAKKQLNDIQEEARKAGAPDRK